MSGPDTGQARVGPPAPVCYDVRITHHRRDPLDYRFGNATRMWLVDLDALPRLPPALAWLCRFTAADHQLNGQSRGGTIRSELDRWLGERGLPRPARVLMLANPRVLGYVFNPLSVFYCYGAEGRLTNVVAEVRNTYRGRHCYLLCPGALRGAEVDKVFYVSPFHPVDGRYEIRVPEPGSQLVVAVTLHRAGARAFTAVLTGSQRRSASLWFALRTPLASRAVMFHIRRHGIRLYTKGLRPVPRPHHTKPPEGDPVTSARTRPTHADAQHWPEIATTPHTPLRAQLARALVRRALHDLPLRVNAPDGSSVGAGTATDPQLRLIRPDAFYRRLGAGNLIGFGEAFMAGDWDSDDGEALVALLTVLATRMNALVPPWLQRLRRVVLARRPAGQDNTPSGARTNIHQHYDLPTEMFAAFLDESMTYSAALFAGDPASTTEPLAAAQRRKIDRLLDVAGVRAGSRVIEIGTGWGELAIRAAARGARVTTTTLSIEQARVAQARVAAGGHSDRVEVRLADYREITGEFDAVLSVEMIEAVGANHWGDYFTAIAALLAPGGKAGLQAITMAHERMLASRDHYTWIVKYIFPGGQIPSSRAIRQHAAAAGLRVGSWLSFGAHYAETLRRWRAEFDKHADDVAALGFDEVFTRMWQLYLAYSEAGFRSGYLDVRQFELTKPAGAQARLR